MIINLPIKFKNLFNVKEFKLRILSTVILLCLFYGLYILGNPFFSFFFIIIFFILFYEFEFICWNKIKKNQIFKILIFQFLLLIFLTSEIYVLNIIFEFSNFLVLLTVSLFINLLFFKTYINWLSFFISNLIILSFFSLINILIQPDGLNYFLYLVILISTMDIFAYLGGKIFGYQKIAPKISKGKTVEGTLIGLCVTILMSIMTKYLVNFDIFQAFIVGFLIGLLAFFGDLLESHLKRDIGVKDSGKVIPGHGGVMDRFDGYFLTLPLYNVYLVN
jgi:phosphatidate cytidylyltransferase